MDLILLQLISGGLASVPPPPGRESVSWTLAARDRPWPTGLQYSFCLCCHEAQACVNFPFLKRTLAIGIAPTLPQHDLTQVNYTAITPTPNKVMPGGSGVRMGAHLGGGVQFIGSAYVCWIGKFEEIFYLIN